MLFSTISNLKSAITCKWRQVVLHVNQFIVESASLYCNFHISYIYHILYFPLCTSTLYFPYFSFFLLMALESRCRPIKRFILVSKKFDHRSVKRTTAKNRERYTLSNIVHIAFQNYSFLSSFLWSRCSERLVKLIENYL